MQAQDVWEVVEPKNPQNDVHVKNDKMVLATIYLGIPKKALLSITEKQPTKVAHDTLKVMYLGGDILRVVKVQTLTA